MRVGIRIKLVVLLALVALLPLLAALITITVEGRRLRRESYGQAIRSLAAAQAIALQAALPKDIEKLYVGLQYEPEVAAYLTARTVPKGPQELKRLDDVWPGLPLDAKPLAMVLHNTIAKRLRRLESQDPLIAEILLTDRFGELVAATQRTEDYYQADEHWWQGAWDEGRGRVFVEDINYDRSAGVWSIDICIPIRRAREVVGIVKAVFNVSRWALQQTRETGAHLSATPCSVMMVQQDGRIFFHDDITRRDKPAPEPLARRMIEWHGEIAAAEKPGWRVTKTGILQGYVRVRMPDRIGPNATVMPSWSLVLYVPASEAFGAVRRLSFHLLVVGLGIIAAIFLAGAFLAERSIARRIRRLGQAARRVAKGDLSYRIRSRSAGRRLLGTDEIDELAKDFNRMVNQVQKSHETLRSANEIRTNFIRVAGHELRTPVSYIMAIAKLLRDNTDPERLANAVQTVGAKAKRLDEIIQAIFKLLPEHGGAAALRYEDVSVSGLLEEVYLNCFPFIETRGQRLITEPPEEPMVIRADRAKLRDVVENLVMNAIKFTPDGGVIKVGARPQLGGYVSITVQDQGPGITEDDLPHIFDPFYSTADVLKHSSGDTGYQKRGMGLGLAIVHHFVELHGGTVHVSTSPAGSTFAATIPCAPPESLEETESDR